METSFLRSMAASAVEVVAGVAMVVIGVVLQVSGSSAKESNPTLTVCGGILVALGGVLLSWMASRIIAERQRDEAALKAKSDAEEALTIAQTEVDEKLNNLSRVLGQSAGQITQAVEKVDSRIISSETGFELISQSNRMIYGQVNEIAVIRKSRFDPAYLTDTAATLDELARELSSRTHSESGAQDSVALASVREKIETVREGLSKAAGSGVRSASEVETTCPYCDKSARLMLGTTPGDTATGTCGHCGEVFNAHRNAAGSAFTRRRGPQVDLSRWTFRCPQCERALSSPKNQKGERFLVCPGCFSALLVDPDAETVTHEGTLDQATAHNAFVSGSRPKAPCPKCGSRINMPLRWAEGFFGYCQRDRVALTVTDAAWDRLVEQETEPIES